MGVLYLAFGGSQEQGRPRCQIHPGACAMFPAHYRFCWRTRDAEAGRTRLPAAMAAGVTGGPMSFEQLFDAVMGGGYATAA